METVRCIIFKFGEHEHKHIILLYQRPFSFKYSNLHISKCLQCKTQNENEAIKKCKNAKFYAVNVCLCSNLKGHLWEKPQHVRNVWHLVSELQQREKKGCTEFKMFCPRRGYSVLFQAASLMDIKAYFAIKALMTIMGVGRTSTRILILNELIHFQMIFINYCYETEG